MMGAGRRLQTRHRLGDLCVSDLRGIRSGVRPGACPRASNTLWYLGLALNRLNSEKEQ